MLARPATMIGYVAKTPAEGYFRSAGNRRSANSASTTLEAAEEAGLEIKKGHPIVRVAVYDTVEYMNRIIELPKTWSAPRSFDTGSANALDSHEDD
jgi:hypothetical protein